jgi:CubicO group peptidase (beta-lactamase class C family)
MIDDEHGIVWHNGGTSNFSSYMGFDPERQIAVVILANLAPGYRIPATVLGAKLLLELQTESN